MVLLTLIGESQARAGNRFLYLGPLSEPECKECRLRGVCFNLEAGHAYTVAGLRDTKHPCAMFEDGVRVVEVERAPTEAAVDRKAAIEGSTVTFEERHCDHLDCANYRLCRPMALKPGTKLRIESLEGDLDCPRGESLLRALLF